MLAVWWLDKPKTGFDTETLFLIVIDIVLLSCLIATIFVLQETSGAGVTKDTANVPSTPENSDKADEAAILHVEGLG